MNSDTDQWLFSVLNANSKATVKTGIANISRVIIEITRNMEPVTSNQFNMLKLESSQNGKKKKKSSKFLLETKILKNFDPYILYMGRYRLRLASDAEIFRFWPIFVPRNCNYQSRSISSKCSSIKPFMSSSSTCHHIFQEYPQKK